MLFGLSGVTGCGNATSSGGAPSSAADQVGLIQSPWELQSYQGSAGAAPAAPDGEAVLQFGTAGKLNGSTGCNQFSATYQANGSQLTIRMGPMTLKACTGSALQAQESALLHLLPEVRHYAISGGVLTLSGVGSGVLLTYRSGLSGLAGTSWTVTGVNTGSAVVSSSLTEMLTAGFGSAGAFNAFGGCNTVAGTYQTSGSDGLTISGLRSTLKTCGTAVDTVEQQYVSALEAVSTYAIFGRQLTLRAADGATQVTLQLIP
jgi:heat shock protein HslJ